MLAAELKALGRTHASSLYVLTTALLKEDQRIIPPAVDHPLWQTWFERAYTDDIAAYGVLNRVHHYVRGYDSLMSIMPSESLWASDVRCLTDTTEFDHGIPICYEALESIQSRVLREHVHLVKEGLAERFHHRTFVTCFSTRNDLKSQWDLYADAQRGFVLSLDSLVVSALSSPQGFRFMPVEYGSAAQVDRARRVVRRALSDLEAVLPGRAPRDAIWSIQSRFVMLAAEMFFLCASFKAARFQSEHEWRLIYTRQMDDDSALPILTRLSSQRAIDYVIVNLRERYAQNELPSFAAVRAGPKTDPNTRVVVQRYLHDSAKHTAWEVQPCF